MTFIFFVTSKIQKMSLLFRLLSLFSFGLNFIWIKKTVWTGQNLKCLVLFSVLLRRYWEKASGRNRRLAGIVFKCRKD
ncbi:hypothetical protein DW035_10730 [Phocaeicola plebeius]|uniref:Uncharacterized protein n=1 Tax=Phocaeicola plebeius TaxID=310297 RepID=A0A415J2Y6_9BACT|nr:hypothetical protein DW041_10585 [Phocaeicola plebeius]RHL14276.1 hypothetical protein DW035_10730 [Phocaeicola plebeius]